MYAERVTATPFRLASRIARNPYHGFVELLYVCSGELCLCFTEYETIRLAAGEAYFFDPT